MILSMMLMIFFKQPKETFYLPRKDYDYSSHISINNLDNKYINLLGTIHTKFLEKLDHSPSNNPFRGTCNDILNKQLQNASIKESLTKLSSESCNNYASRICQEVDPRVMIISNRYAKISEINPPKTLNNTCYNNLLNCCKNI